MAEQTEVSLAVLDTKLDGLHKKVDGIIERIDKMNGRVQTHDVEIARLQEKQTTWAKIQAGISLSLSALAAYVGVQR